MAVLEGGQTWGLRQRTTVTTTNTIGTNNGLDNNSRHKTVVLVKLTDASLRALENYVHNESVFPQSSNTSSSAFSSRSSPSIRFPSGHNDSGTICIPLGQDGKKAEFSFTLSSNDEAQGPKGSFECLSLDKQGSLESIGSMQEKLHVQASDDTYTRFGQKMEQAKKESEKRTTQFLDKRPPASSTSAAATSRMQFVRKTAASAPLLPAAKAHSSKDSAIGSSSSNYLPGTHPMLDRGGAKSPYNKISHVNSDLMRRPLRERIIHLLAVRPFKKPELISRIVRDGILEKDRKNITLILKQVSFMKDNTYHLLRHMWNDVSEDWLHYSEQERQSFRRRKPQNLTPPCSDGSTSSSGHSPSSTHPASPPTTTSSSAMMSSPAKRSAYYANGGNDDIAAAAAAAKKKKRVSNYVRPADMRLSNGSNFGDHVSGGESPLKGSPLRSPGRSPLGVSNLATAAAAATHHHHNNHHQTVPFSSWSSPSQQQQQQQNSPRPAAAPRAVSSLAVQQQQLGASEQVPIQQQQQQQLAKDYLYTFSTIQSKDQRAQYKKEFSDNYTKYRLLHATLERVSRRFAQLETQLKQEEQGTEAFKMLKQKIVREYQENKQDQTFLESKKEFQYLHEKLAHIKKLVHDYDVGKNATTTTMT